MDLSGSGPKQAELFLQLLSTHQRRISGFVHTLVPSWEDAEEIMQDVNLILWRKFDSFDPSTDFFSWGAQIAQFEVLNYRRRRRNTPNLLSEAVIDQLTETSMEISEELVIQRELLAFCMEKLTANDQSIVNCWYKSGGKVQVVAQLISRSESMAYKSIRRIRSSLMACIKSQAKVS